MRWVRSGSVQFDDGGPRSGRVGTDSWGRKRIFIGIGGLATCAEPDVAIQTMALGSCVGLMVHDPARGLIGMAHIALPDSSYDGDRAAQEPGRYADTALPALLRAMARLGGDERGRGMAISIAGGASILGDASLFDIGRRNSDALLAALQDRQLRPQACDIGGAHSRTVIIEADGRIQLSCPGRQPWSL